jgi:hypothetical protein
MISPPLLRAPRHRVSILTANDAGINMWHTKPFRVENGAGILKHRPESGFCRGLSCLQGFVFLKLSPAPCSPALILSAQDTALDAVPASVLHRGLGGEPDVLDPHKTTLTVETTILTDIYEGLVKLDARGTIVPGAASGWDLSDDGLTWAFHLREALLWSDASPRSRQGRRVPRPWNRSERKRISVAERPIVSGPRIRTPRDLRPRPFQSAP